MKSFRSIAVGILLIGIVLPSFSQGYHVRIGTIGNSITQGVGLSNPSTQAFAVVLNDLLQDVYGDTCIVKNFGLTTTTMLKNGDVSYWDCQQFRDYLDYAPEICFIMLGTNDSKPQNWDSHGDEFIGDYLAMIDTIKQRNPSTKFLLAYPPPAFVFIYGIRDSIILNGVIPAIDSVRKVVDTDLIDFYHPLLDSADLFYDGIHPNENGHRVMAEMIRDTLIGTNLIHRADTGFTFITEFSSSISPLPLGDSATLSWTTINADSVLMDGVKIATEGSINVSPSETTTYEMIAYGQKSNDTIRLVQETYTPELTKLTLNPYKVTRYTGDTVFFQTYYWDQLNKKITDTYFSVDWNITQGSGSLFGASDTSVYFVAESTVADTSTLEVSYGDISGTAQIITREALAIRKLSGEDPVKVFPNPADQILQVRFMSPASEARVELFDTQGKLMMSKELFSVHSEQELTLNVDALSKGSYILKVSLGDLFFTEKISIR